MLGFIAGLFTIFGSFTLFAVILAIIVTGGQFFWQLNNLLGDWMLGIVKKLLFGIACIFYLMWKLIRPEDISQSSLPRPTTPDLPRHKD